MKAYTLVAIKVGVAGDAVEIRYSAHNPHGY